MNKPIDEKYTVEYIEREAMLILRFASKDEKRRFGDIPMYLRERDRKIIKEWRLK